MARCSLDVQMMTWRPRHTTMRDGREQQAERTVSAWPEGAVTVVRVGRRTRVIRQPLHLVTRILRRLERYPAPVIWRALGVAI